MKFKRRTGFHNCTSIARDWQASWVGRTSWSAAGLPAGFYREEAGRANTRTFEALEWGIERRLAKTTMTLRTLLLLVPWALRAQPAPAPVIEELVTANRILVNEGVLDAYGHVSVRDPANPNYGRFIAEPFERGFGATIHTHFGIAIKL